MAFSYLGGWLLFLSALTASASDLPALPAGPKLERRQSPSGDVLFFCDQGRAYEVGSDALRGEGLLLLPDGSVREAAAGKTLSAAEVMSQAGHLFAAAGPCGAQPGSNRRAGPAEVSPDLAAAAAVDGAATFDGSSSRISETFNINDGYSGAVRTSPAAYSSVGPSVNPADRPFITLSGSMHRNGNDNGPIQFKTYYGEWYGATPFHNVTAVVHFNALSDGLPFYVFADLYTAHHKDPNSSLQADTFGAGAELPLSRSVTAKAELARGYYSGDDSTAGSLKIEGSVSLDQLRGRPAAGIERPLVSSGAGVTYTGDTKHMRWHRDDDPSVNFTPQLFASVWGTLHFNAITPWLPFYLAASLVDFASPGEHRHEMVDAYTIGLEQAFLKYFVFQADWGKTYLGGAQGNVYSAGLSSSFSLSDLLKLSSSDGAP